MEHLHHGQYVWLRSIVGNVYLHADDDGLGVSLRANRASRNAAWRVQVHSEGGILVLFQGAAYGRYLAVTEESAPPGHSGLGTKQLDYDDPEATSITWQRVMDDDMMLFHVSPHGFRFLCANMHQGEWETAAVTIVGLDNVIGSRPRVYWVVQPIPLRDTIPLLPGPRPRAFISILLRRNVEEDQMREVWYVRAGRDGLVDENWVAFPFAGRSLFNLRTQLAPRLGVEGEFILCVRAGHEARLTPLVVDLPASNDPLHIVILMAGSPAIEELRYPDVDTA